MFLQVKAWRAPARLMRALGPEAAGIWAELDAHEARALTAAMDALGDSMDGESEAARSFVEAHRRLRPAAATTGSVWSRLSAIDTGTLAALFANEHPQTIAFILSQLSGNASARLLRGLNPKLAIDAMHRLLHIDQVHPAACASLESLIAKHLDSMVGDGNSSGHERVARIFDGLDSRSEKAFLEALDNAEPGSGEKVRALMFTFDDLARLDAAGLQNAVVGWRPRDARYRLERRLRNDGCGLLCQYDPARRRAAARRNFCPGRHAPQRSGGGAPGACLAGPQADRPGRYSRWQPDRRRGPGGMTQRAVKSVQPFEFRSDFTLTPEPEQPALPTEGQLTLTGPELARLLSEARSEGLAEAARLESLQAEERLQAVTHSLNDALADLVSLARHLEAGAYEGLDIAVALDLINASAQRIVDGQGDLFAER